MTAGSAALAAARRFAAALDRDDWSGARDCLADDCAYVFRGSTTVGAEPIILSYQKIGEWVRATFESVSYESAFESTPPNAIITFRDVMAHHGNHLDFRCRQAVEVNAAGRIVRIEHIDIPGEPEKVEAFNRACGVTRPV